MSRFSSIYKQTMPTRRVVSGENTYEKGMYWSNQALGAGYSKTLLNLEIDGTSGVLKVPGGFSTQILAAGNGYIDQLEYVDNPTKNVLVSQPRNNILLAAYEGINNILSVQKLNAKDVLQQTRSTPQYLNSIDNVSCYKIIVYNPFNHRATVITLLQTIDSSYVINSDLSTYRLHANPISTGFAELWENTVSNNLEGDNPPDDSYTVRARRMKLDETFNKKLLHDYAMQSFAHTEGYGSKTFLFTNKVLSFMEEPIYSGNDTFHSEKDTVVTSLPDIDLTSTSGYTVGDIIYFKPDISSPIFLNIFSNDLYPAGNIIQPIAIQVTTIDSTVPGGRVLYYKLIQPGRFIDCHIGQENYLIFGGYNSYPLVYSNADGVTGVITAPITLSSLNLLCERRTIVSINKMMSNTEEYLFDNDAFIGKHTTTGYYDLNPLKTDNPPDYEHYGNVRTGLGILQNFTRHAPEDPEYPGSNPGKYNITRLDPTPDGYDTLWFNIFGDTIAFSVDLKTGILQGVDSHSFPGLCCNIFVNPVIGLSSSAESPNAPVVDLNKIFKEHYITDTSRKIYLPDCLTDAVKKGVKIGQSLRVAAYCKVTGALDENKVLINTNPDVDLTNYYRVKTPSYSSVFILNYTWDGNTWQFDFQDVRYSVPKWSNIKCSTDGTLLSVSTVNQTNKLSYLDVVTKDNINDLIESNLSPSHTEDHPTYLVDVDEEEVLSTTDLGEHNLDLNLDRSISDLLNTGVENNIYKKLNNTQYGMFKIEPKELTPAMASKWGYNMLSPAPYNFLCQNTPGLSTVLTGTLLMKDNLPLLTPLVNTPGELYIYYSADFSAISSITPQRYQITVEYKNIYDEWRTLKEFSIAESHTLLSSGEPIQIPFSSPDEIVLIRVNILNRAEVVNVALTDGTTEDHFLVVSTLVTTLSFTKNAAQAGTSPLIYDLGTALGLTYWKGRLVCWGVKDAENMLFMSEPNEPDYFAYPNGTDIFEENIKHVINFSDSLIVFTSTKLWRVNMSTDGLSWSKTLLQQNIRIDDKDIPYITTIKNMLFFKSDKQFFMLVPQSGGVVGSLTIAPISKPITDFLKDPFKNLSSIFDFVYHDLKTKAKPIFDYMVKYGVHIEQDKIFIDWWFDLSDWKDQKSSPGKHEMINAYKDKEYWLIQLVYDTQQYAWSLRFHTTNSIGVFVSDAANSNTDYISTVFCGVSGLYTGAYEYDTFGITISHRDTISDSLLESFSFGAGTILLNPTYPRFQTLDTGFKEVSTPALKKHFREVQLTLEPISSDVSFKPIMEVSIDGNEILTHSTPVVTEEDQGDGTKVIKVIEQINYQDLATSEYSSQFTTDNELNNTFTLDSSTLEGVKYIKVRKAINGKGYLAKLNFTNTTEADYVISGHSFVYKSKNAR